MTENTEAKLREELKNAEATLIAVGKKGDLDALEEAFGARNRARTALVRAETETARINEEAEYKRINELTSGVRTRLLAFVANDPDFEAVVKTTKVRTLYLRYNEEGMVWQLDVTLPRKAVAAKLKGTTANTVRGKFSTLEASGLTSREALEAQSAAGNEDAAKVLAAIEDAKSRGKASPGFDSTLKKLIGSGLITVD